MMLRYTVSAHTTGPVLVAREDLILLASADDELAGRLWTAVGGGATGAEVLDVLTSRGISSTPDFALISGLGAPLSVITVRGAFEAHVRAGSDDHALTGRGVSSWVEHPISELTSVSISSHAANDRRLPLVAGCVLASGLEWAALGLTASITAPAADVEQMPAVSVRPDTVSPAPAVDVAPALQPPPPPVPPPPAPEVTIGTAAMTIAPPPETSETDPEVPASDESGYDHLFGETVYRSVEDAAVRAEDEDAQEGGASPESDVADRTVIVEDIAALRAQRRAARGRTPVVAASPSFAIELPDGTREPLEHSMIVGRAPSATRVSGAALPRLVTITTPNQDISRNHVRITLEGETVVVTDLHSMNGTLVTLPGRPAQRLRDGEPAPVVDGAIIDLGDGARLVVREV